MALSPCSRSRFAQARRFDLRRDISCSDSLRPTASWAASYVRSSSESSPLVRTPRTNQRLMLIDSGFDSRLSAGGSKNKTDNAREADSCNFNDRFFDEWCCMFETKKYRPLSKEVLIGIRLAFYKNILIQ